jgi:rhodanese-related sulfurtransferase
MAPMLAEISDQGFERLKRDPNVVVLDVRPPEEYAKGHLPDSVNIPFAELQKRLVSTIPQSNKVAVDCSHYYSSYCDVVAIMLEESGFRSIALLNKGAFASAKCRF